MGIENKYSSWYDSYRREQQEEQKAPYRIVKIENDVGVPVSGLENERMNAVSPAQARFLFLRKYPRLRDYLETGFRIEAELDEELLRQRQQIAEMEKERYEEQVEEAWWNQ